MTARIAAIGEVLWDMFPEGPRFGGAPANVASHAAALGLDASMVSSVGEDSWGQRALEELRQRHVHTDFVNVLSGYPTGAVQVEVDESGKPQYTIEQPAAWDHLAWSPAMQDFAGQCDAICFGTLGQRHEVAREVIRQFVAAVPAAALRVCDVNLRSPFWDEQVLRRSLEWANVLKISDEELQQVAAASGCSGTEDESLAELLDNWGLHLIAITRGSQGATLLDNNHRSDCQAAAVDVKDTVGAGDAFTATLISGLLHGADLDDICRQASRIAGFVCTQSGATPALPAELIEKLWDRTAG